MFEREIIGIPERTYHGSIPEDGYKKVIIKEEGMRDAPLPMLDNSLDINWGYGGGGPARLGDALAADAFDDVNLADAFSGHLRSDLVKNLDMNSPFVLSRDRIVIEGIIAFNDFVQKLKAGQGILFSTVVKELLQKQADTRDKLMSLLSKNAMRNLSVSNLGIRHT